MYVRVGGCHVSTTILLSAYRMAMTHKPHPLSSPSAGYWRHHHHHQTAPKPPILLWLVSLPRYIRVYVNSVILQYCHHVSVCMCANALRNILSPCVHHMCLHTCAHSHRHRVSWRCGVSALLVSIPIWSLYNVPPMITS